MGIPFADRRAPDSHSNAEIALKDAAAGPLPSISSSFFVLPSRETVEVEGKTRVEGDCDTLLEGIVIVDRPVSGLTDIDVMFKEEEEEEEEEISCIIGVVNRTADANEPPLSSTLSIAREGHALAMS